MQSALTMNTISFNQAMSDFTFIFCNLIYISFDRAEKSNMYEIAKTTFIKVVIGIGIDDIENLDGLLILAIIDQNEAVFFY